MNEQTVKDVAVEAAKASPPVAVLTSGLVTEWTLNNVLTAVTIVYVILQIGWLVWRWYQAVHLPAGGPVALPGGAPAPKGESTTDINSTSGNRMQRSVE